MSYDISLTINTGIKDIEVEAWNYTSNVSPMWRKALGFPIKDLHLRKASEAIEDLKRAIKDMKDNPDTYLVMNPQNGWGNYGGAVNFLQNILKGCEENPECRIEVCN